MTGTRTTPIHDRDEDNRTRSQRTKQMKRGPGWFVYDGGHFVTEHHPTIKRTNKREPVMDNDGGFATDSAGRVVYRNAGEPVHDEQGRPQLGGPPKVVRTELDSVNIWGTEFAKGEPVHVDNPLLALKLRCLGTCRELSSEEAEAITPAPEGEQDSGSGESKKRSRRSHKAHDES